MMIQATTVLPSACGSQPATGRPVSGWNQVAPRQQVLLERADLEARGELADQKYRGEVEDEDEPER